MKIGNIEALVAGGGLDTGANPVMVPRLPSPKSKSVNHPIVNEPLSPDDDPAAPLDDLASPLGDPPSPLVNTTPSVGPTLDPPPGGVLGTGVFTTKPAGPLAAITPDAVSGRTFGHSVVSEQSGRPGVLVWLIGFTVLGGLAWFAYTLLTSK